MRWRELTKDRKFEVLDFIRDRFPGRRNARIFNDIMQHVMNDDPFAPANIRLIALSQALSGKPFSEARRQRLEEVVEFVARLQAEELEREEV